MKNCRRSTTIALAIAALFSLVTQPAALGRAQHDAGVYVNVDIDGIGPARVDALKALPSVRWWIELDRQLLVHGSRHVLAELSGFRFREVDRSIDPSELCVLYGRGAGEAGVPVLASGGRCAVISASPDQRERLTHLFDHEGCGRVPHADNAIRPLVPNSVLAHQAANSPASAAKADFDVAIQALVDAVDPVRWRNDVQTLGTYNRYTRGSGNLAARDWLVAQFQALPGLTVTTPNFTCPVEAERRPTTSSQR